MSWLSQIVDTATGKAPVKKQVEQVKDAGRNAANEASRATTPIAEENQRRQWDELKKRRQEDAAAGREAGMRDFYEGSLGRVGPGQAANYDDLIKQRQALAQTGVGNYGYLIDREKNIMNRGYNADEYAAARESRMRQMLRLQQEQQRALQGKQANMGLRGGVAGAQFTDLMRGQGRDRMQAEQELMLEQIARQDKASDNLRLLEELAAKGKTDALKGLEDVLGAADKSAFDRDTFNIDQRGKEILGLNARELAEMGFGVAERGSVIGSDAAKYAADVQRNASGGSKK